MFTKKEENLGVPITKLCVSWFSLQILSQKENLLPKGVFSNKNCLKT